MINEIDVILKAISKKTGLNIEQVKQGISSGDIGKRYDLCSDCIMPKCGRCQVSFSQKIIKRQ